MHDCVGLAQVRPNYENYRHSGLSWEKLYIHRLCHWCGMWHALTDCATNASAWGRKTSIQLGFEPSVITNHGQYGMIVLDASVVDGGSISSGNVLVRATHIACGQV